MSVPEPQSSALPPSAPREKPPAGPPEKRRVKRGPSASAKPGAKAPPQRPIPWSQQREEEEQPFFLFERTFWVRFWEHLNGEAGAGYLLSFLFHMALLALLAIPVIRELRQEEPIVTILAGADEAPADIGIGESIDVGVALAQAEAAPSDGTDSAPDLMQLDAGALSPIDVNPDELQV